MKEAAVIRIGLVVLAGCSADGRRDASVLVPVHFVGGLAAERGDEATPRARPRGARVAAVATVGTWWVREDEEAASYTCALLEDGRVKCWGRQHDVGAEAVGDQPGEMGGALRVVDLGADENGLGRRATHLAVGRGHACVVLTTGNVHCWGDNDLSQLGYQPVSRFEEGLDLTLRNTEWFRSDVDESAIAA